MAEKPDNFTMEDVSKFAHDFVADHPDGCVFCLQQSQGSPGKEYCGLEGGTVFIESEHGRVEMNTSKDTITLDGQSCWS